MRYQRPQDKGSHPVSESLLANVFSPETILAILD